MQGCHAALCCAGQVVRSALQTEKGKDVVMFWYLEAIEMPERPRGLFGVSPFQFSLLLLSHFLRLLADFCPVISTQGP